MAEITATLVKTLREKTNAGMMDCKGALKEADGDLDKAETILRKKGIAAAGKKALRAATEGVISSRISGQDHIGVLMEVNCETDFVAKNENFQSFVADLTEHATESSQADDMESMLKEDYGKDPGGKVEEAVKAKIAELGENIVPRRFVRFRIEDGAEGSVGSYLHFQKVGVLLELGCEKAETAASDDFRALVKDITLHIAASHPVCISRDQVPEDLVSREKDIFADQVKNKPAEIVEKIVAGKLDKYYSTICLLEQAFIKDADKSVDELLKEKASALGDTITVRRFERYQVGEEI